MTVIISGSSGITNVNGTAAAPAETGTTSTNTGIFFPAANTLGFSTSGTEVGRFDSSGNLGLGVTPSAWGSSFKALELPAGSSLITNSSDYVGLISNAYNNGTSWLYKSTAPAGRYLVSQNSHQWYSAASGTAGNAITFTQAMTLDASGNLGIGTTSPSTRLHVAGATTATSQVTTQHTGSSITTVFGCDGGIDAGAVYVTTNHPLAFKTNNTERARIDSSGNFMVGQTSTNRRFAATHNVANYTAEISNSNGTPYGIYVLYSGAAPNNTGSGFIQAVDTGGARFDFRSNGGLANYSANNVNLSDRREKTNFAPAKSYLETICAIPVQTFNYIDQNMEEDPGLTLGVVAQDVQSVAPELVMESNWGTEEEPKMRLSIYQTDLQYALMKCIQEQQALITQLTERITALETAKNA